MKNTFTITSRAWRIVDSLRLTSNTKALSLTTTTTLHLNKNFSKNHKAAVTTLRSAIHSRLRSWVTLLKCSSLLTTTQSLIIPLSIIKKDSQINTSLSNSLSNKLLIQQEQGVRNNQIGIISNLLKILRIVLKWDLNNNLHSNNHLLLRWGRVQTSRPWIITIAWLSSTVGKKSTKAQQPIPLLAIKTHSNSSNLATS